MSLEDFDLFTIDLESVHFFQCRFQIIRAIEAHFAPALANALMRIGIGDLATLAEDILQLAPARKKEKLVILKISKNFKRFALKKNHTK